MKRVKRLLAALLVVAMVASMPLSAFAAKKVKGSVPTSGDFYMYDDQLKKDDKRGSFVASFDKKGRIKTYKYTDVNGSSYELIYKWKGDRLKSETVNVVENEFDYKWDSVNDKEQKIFIGASTYTSKTTYKFKKKLLKKSTTVETYTERGKAPISTTEVSKYTWNKRTATVKNTNSATGSRSITSVKVNKKNKLASSWTGQWNVKYKKGVIVKETRNVKGTYENYSYTRLYNKYGYETYYNSVNTDTHGTVIMTTNYDWVMSGKVPVQVNIRDYYKHDYADPTEKDYDNTSISKVVFTGTMPVKQMRNCDAYGLETWLGVGSMGGDGLVYAPVLSY